jgi:pimeloyl-ACP methyl ester carboxylesterase
MSRMYRMHCCLFDWLLIVQCDDLTARYGDEIRMVFRDELSRVWREGMHAILRLWVEVIFETAALAAPTYMARARLVLAATSLASMLTVGSALGFCTLGPSHVVHACSQDEPSPKASSPHAGSGSVVQLPDGHHMFLECSGEAGAVPTVILANGRGLGVADNWAKVQEKVPATIRVCSYDAIGAGRSDPFQPHPELRPIDQVISEMHALFRAGGLKQPYVLVGASAGGILIRRYQEEHPSEVAGLVFVDSAHEEMLWRFAEVLSSPDPNRNDPAFLRENGFLANHEKLAWHADIPLIVLERTERPPRSTFPSQLEYDAEKATWHSFQVDLAGRSKYGELRAVAGSGHMMHVQRPDAIADAIRDVVGQVQSMAR